MGWPWHCADGEAVRFLGRLRRAIAAPPETPVAPTFPWPDPAAGDPLLAMALALAPGRRIVLTGKDAHRLARASLALRREGAAFTLVATEVPPHNADDILREEALRWAMVDWAAPMLATLRGPRGSAHTGALMADAVADWWVAASLSGDTLVHHAGAIDLLLDLDRLEAADPLARLTALAATGARALLFKADAGAARWLPEAGFTPVRERVAGGSNLFLGQRA